MDKPVPSTSEPRTDPRALADFLERKFPGQYPCLVEELRKPKVTRPKTAQSTVVER